jgi:hypothetical protein
MAGGRAEAALDRSEGRMQRWNQSDAGLAEQCQLAPKSWEPIPHLKGDFSPKQTNHHERRSVR